MAIDKHQMPHFRKWRKKYPDGKKLAILGDCYFHYAQNATKESFAKELSFNACETFDLLGKPTHRMDLNQPLSGRFLASYDWVIDAGTSYCCFDIAQVYRNILDMLISDGVAIISGSLFGFTNRGYYSIHPSIFWDFFAVNGFAVEEVLVKPKQANVWQPYTDRKMFWKMPQVPNDTLVMAMMKRSGHPSYRAPVPSHFVEQDKKS